MKKTFVIVPVGLLVLVLSLVLAPYAVQAHAEGQTLQAEQQASKQAGERARAEAQQLSEQRKEAAKKRQEELQRSAAAALEAQKQKSEQEQMVSDKRREAFQQACADRRAGFKNRMMAVTSALQNRADKLDVLVERVKAFVADKHLIVANYEALLTDVGTQQGIVDTVAAAAKSAADDFDCADKDTAKASVAEFGDSLHQQMEVIQAYKTAIKNLIMAVKTAAQEAGNATQ